MEEQQAKTPQEVIKNKGNVIKTRDDRELILIDFNGKVVNPEKCSWTPNDGETVSNSVFRSRIEPWLTSLFQSEHLSLLWVWNNKCNQFLIWSRKWNNDGWNYIL